MYLVLRWQAPHTPSMQRVGALKPCCGELGGLGYPDQLFSRLGTPRLVSGPISSLCPFTHLHILPEGVDRTLRKNYEMGGRLGKWVFTMCHWPFFIFSPILPPGGRAETSPALTDAVGGPLGWRATWPATSRVREGSLLLLLTPGPPWSQI